MGLGPILERYNAFQWTLPLPLGVFITLRLIHTEGKREFSLMLVTFSLIFFACSLHVEAYCERKKKPFSVSLQINRSEPTKLDTWQAHDSAIIGVQIAAHEAGVFLITASTDHTAKLWDMKGHCVGMFGQVSSTCE